MICCIECPRPPSHPLNSTSPTLLERLRAGDDADAWNRFVSLYTPLLILWCRRVGMSDADAADLLQVVFVKLFEGRTRFEYDAGRSFRAYLKTMLLNAWRNELRGRRSRPAGDELEALLAAADTDPRFELDEAEYRGELVRRALALMQERFEPTTWRACWEFVVEDRSAGEVATELGITANAVYLAKSRVLKCLRDELRGLW